jgi:hypothetical protein
MVNGLGTHELEMRVSEPDILSSDVLEARAHPVGGFAKYLKVPREGRQDASHFIEQLEEVMREAGMDETEIACVIMLHYWA